MFLTKRCQRVPNGNVRTLYPTHYKFKYPKAGENNSLITIKVFDTQYDRYFFFDIGNNPDIYIPRIMWSKKKMN